MWCRDGFFEGATFVSIEFLVQPFVPKFQCVLTSVDTQQFIVLRGSPTVCVKAGFPFFMMCRFGVFVWSDGFPALVREESQSLSVKEDRVPQRHARFYIPVSGLENTSCRCEEVTFGMKLPCQRLESWGDTTQLCAFLCTDIVEYPHTTPKERDVFVVGAQRERAYLSGEKCEVFVLVALDVPELKLRAFARLE